jgi:cytochrome c biogenesis protein CcmG/thiol:disulfide interchange protein DsbE
LPSTPSSTERRFSRGRLVALIAVSVAIPAIALALILRNDGDGPASAPGGTTTPTVPTPRKAKIGSIAPDFRGRDLAGKEVTLSSLRGRPVVLTFFASWCHPCEQEMPSLQRVLDEQQGRLAVLGVNYRDIDDDTRAFVQRLGVTFPAVAEDTGDNPIAKRYDVHEMPDTIFIDAKGVVRDRTWGPLGEADLRAAVNRLTASA